MIDNSVYRSALSRMGLLPPGVEPTLTPLTGGVSSDILRVEFPGTTLCIKRSLSQLRVQAEWLAPVERNRWEVKWMRVAAEALPDAVPRILGEDAESGMFAMEFLPEARFPVWKALLRDGIISAEAAEEVGNRLGILHARSAKRADLAELFATDHIFHPIRLDPYLGATARAHPDLSGPLNAIIHTTATTKLALVHGDISPKNILLGPRGPVFLDAECAWYGDPAFDLSFCLNHFLLKCLWRPQWTSGYLECFDALVAAYRSHIHWELPDALEARAARLLPGLFLARVDGKSPVEYVTDEADRNLVRTVARPLIIEPVGQLAEIRTRWLAALQSRT